MAAPASAPAPTADILIHFEKGFLLDNLPRLNDDDINLFTVDPAVLADLERRGTPSKELLCISTRTSEIAFQISRNIYRSPHFPLIQATATPPSSKYSGTQNGYPITMAFTPRVGPVFSEEFKNMIYSIVAPQPAGPTPASLD